jgi:hypothetical protein
MARQTKIKDLAKYNIAIDQPPTPILGPCTVVFKDDQLEPSTLVDLAPTECPLLS